MGLTRSVLVFFIITSPAVFCINHRRVTHITLPAATIDITQGTACNVSGGASSKILCSKGIVNGTKGTSGIDVFIHFATKKSNISSTIDITTSSHTCTFLTKTTTISIVSDIGTLMDNDVGVVFVGLGCSVVNLSRSCPSIGQVGLGVVKIAVAIGSNGKVCRVQPSTERPSSLPDFVPMIIIIIIRDGTWLSNAFRLGRYISIHVLLYTLGIEHTSSLTATINLPDRCAGLQVYLRVFRPGLWTIACTIHRGRGHAILITVLPDGHINIDSTKDGAALTVVTTIDGTLHQFVTLLNGCLYACLNVLHLLGS